MQDINICLISVGHGWWRWDWGWDVLLFSVCLKCVKIQNEEEKKRPETKWPGKYNPRKWHQRKQGERWASPSTAGSAAAHGIKRMRKLWASITPGVMGEEAGLLWPWFGQL